MGEWNSYCRWDPCFFLRFKGCPAKVFFWTFDSWYFCCRICHIFSNLNHVNDIFFLQKSSKNTTKTSFITSLFDFYPHRLDSSSSGWKLWWRGLGRVTYPLTVIPGFPMVTVERYFGKEPLKAVSRFIEARGSHGFGPWKLLKKKAQGCYKWMLTRVRCTSDVILGMMKLECEVYQTSRSGYTEATEFGTLPWFLQLFQAYFTLW